MSSSRSSIALFVLAAAIVLFTFQDYGVTWDESYHVRYGDGVLQYLASGFTDRGSFRFMNLHYYGALFDLLCAVATRLSPLALYDTRHLLNAAVALVGVLGCWFLARELGTTRTAFLAALLLLLTPRWWGHGFNNPKDIPFAAGYVWSVFCIVRLMPLLPHVPWRPALATGLAIGATLAIRVGGLVLFGYLGLAMLVAVKPRLESLKTLALGFLRIAVPAWAVMLLFWPWAQGRPLRAPFEALQLKSSIAWHNTVLFAGREIYGSEIPSRYEAQWLLITLPEIVLLGLLLSLWYLPREGRRYGMILFAVVFPIAYIAIQKPVIYDGMRHVLFVVPLMACLAARACELAYESWSRRRPRLAHAGLAVLAVYLVYHLLIMVRLHPNQVVYFNALVGGLPGAYGRYETDYWGNTYREAVGMLVEHIEAETASPPPPYRVYACSNPVSSSAFFPPYLSPTRDKEDADFLLGTTRWNCHESMEGRVIGVVERLGTPLNYVLDLRPSEPPGGPRAPASRG